MLNPTQALSEATLNDYLKSLKKMEAYSKKFDSTRLPIAKFTESIRSSVERAPAWTRQMIINIEDAVDAHIRRLCILNRSWIVLSLAVLIEA